MVGRDFPLKIQKLNMRTSAMTDLLIILLMKMGNCVRAATLILELMTMMILHTTQELKLKLGGMFELVLMLWAMGIWVLSLPKGISGRIGSLVILEEMRNLKVTMMTTHWRLIEGK